MTTQHAPIDTAEMLIRKPVAEVFEVSLLDRTIEPLLTLPTRTLTEMGTRWQNKRWIQRKDLRWFLLDLNLFLTL